MVKKAVIVISLVEESGDRPNVELEKDIFQAVSNRRAIPWLANVEKVKVVEE